MPVSEGVAVRRVSRAIQQWQVDRIRATPMTKKRGLPLPWWSYPTAVAAAIIIGFLIWSSRQPIPGINKEGGVAVLDDQSSDERQQAEDGGSKTLADWMDSSFGVTAEASAAVPGDETTPPLAGTDDGVGGSMFPTREETLQ